MFLYYPFNAHGLCKDQDAVAYFKMIPFPLPLREAWGHFLPPDIRYDNLVGFLEVKFTKAWESLMTRSPLVSPTYPKWASNNSSITVQAFLPQDWVFWRFLLWQVTIWVTVFNLFSSPIWWAMVFPEGFSVVGMEGSRSGRWKIGENNYRRESNIMVLIKDMTVIEQSLSKS